jgi:hypothetical protein
MPLKVIGAGYGRTGTSSLKQALEKLGFGPCHHMYEIIIHPEQGRFWDALARGETVNWDDVFEGYSSSVDWPSCKFYRELADHYPDAKVILSLREPHAWYKSVSETIMPSMKGPMVLPNGKRVGPPGDFAKILIGDQTFSQDFSEDHMIDIYLRHNEEVKRTIPKDRLLVFEAKDGWEPLCKFLGVPVPAEPYPKLNTTEDMQARRKAMMES